MLGLRLSRGVRSADHAPARWREVTARYGAAFAAASAAGRLVVDADGARIARADRFVADDIIAWVMAEADRHVSRRVDARGAAVDSRATASVV
jgi:hypothetical protein